MVPPFLLFLPQAFWATSRILLCKKTLSLGLLPPPRYNHGIFSSFFYFFLSLLPLPHFSFLSSLIFILLLLPSKGWG
jgi:hypothetical protein